jgi:arsenate reductase (thioredoxin)
MIIEALLASHFTEVLEIYRQGIATGKATFETELPLAIDFDKKFLSHSRIVAIENSKVVGWAALSPVSNRECYKGVAEVTVYVHHAYRHKGIGKELLHSLIDESERQGIWSLLSVIHQDNTNSIRLHLQCGFRTIGSREQIAAIKGNWKTTVMMEKRSAVNGLPLNNTEKKKLLFVCIENSNRSQMSQAFAKIHGGYSIEAYSAGSKPSGIINPKAIAAMKELGYDLSTHDSKSLDEVKEFAPFDAVITMGCGDACPWMPAKQFIDWQIPDPKHMEPAEFNKVRDFIEEKVKTLIRELA